MNTPEIEGREDATIPRIELKEEVAIPGIEMWENVTIPGIEHGSEGRSDNTWDRRKL